MPTRRELIGFAFAVSISPLSLARVNTIEAKLVPLIRNQKGTLFSDIDYKAYIALALSKVNEYIDTHKIELLEYGLIILALSLILAAGIPPTKELILYLVL